MGLNVDYVFFRCFSVAEQSLFDFLLIEKFYFFYSKLYLLLQLDVVQLKVILNLYYYGCKYDNKINCYYHGVNGTSHHIRYIIFAIIIQIPTSALKEGSNSELSRSFSLHLKLNTSTKNHFKALPLTTTLQE